MRPSWLHLSPFPPHITHREVMFRDFTVSGIARGNQEGIGIILTAPPLHTYKNTPDFSIMEIIEKTPTLKVILEMYSECDQTSVN